MDAHIATHRQPGCLRLAHQIHTGAAGQTAQVHARAGGLEQLEDRVQRNGFGCHGHARQSQPRRQRSAGRHALAQMELLRPQPDGIAKGGSILQRALQHLGAGQGHVGLAEAHAAGLGEFRHLGEHLACQPARQRAEREQARLVELFCAELEHLDQPWLVKHRVGIGRTDQAGHTAGHGRRHLGFEHAFMLMAWLSQPCREIDQPRQHKATTRIDHAVGGEVLGFAVHRDDAARSQCQVAHLVEAAGRVDHPTVLDEYLHGFKPNWPLTPVQQALAAIETRAITLRCPRRWT